MQLSFLSETEADSFAGRLGIRTKLAICLSSSVTSIVLNNASSLSLLAVVSTLYALTAVSPKMLVKVYCFVVLMLLISFGFIALNTLIIPGLIKWEVNRFVVPYLRMVVTLNALFALAFSSRIKDVMRELKSFGRVRWIQIPLTVAVRFLPTFIDDCAQIMDAYRLRKPLGKRSFFNKITTCWRAIVVPLTFRLLRSADDLAVAAELKGIGENKSQHAKGAAFTRSDGLVLSLALLSFTFAGIIQYLYGATVMR